jgi:predicted nucleic acid-binding protein
VSLYYDSGVLVKLYVREDRSDEVTRFVARRGESVAVNRLHELEIRNALRLKRFRDEIDDVQLAASLGMIAADFAERRLIRHEADWQVIHDEAERLSSAVTGATVGVRTIDVIHIAAALTQMATGVVSFDRRQLAAARMSGLRVVELTG